MTKIINNLFAHLYDSTTFFWCKQNVVLYIQLKNVLKNLKKNKLNNKKYICIFFQKYFLVLQNKRTDGKNNFRVKNII